MENVYCLLVDDSRTARILLSTIIKRLCPVWQLSEAENGQQALDMASTQNYQVIFLDHNMPDMNGGEVARVLRPKFPDSRIALLTANIQDTIKNLAIEINIDFIPKPITPEKITNYING